MRREAAWWKLRRAVEVVLHQELTGLGLKPMTEERKTAALYGGKVFRSLYRTRGLRPALRERRLARCRDWAVKKRLDAVVRDSLAQSLTVLFGEMNDDGQLDALPAPEEARHLMLLKPSMRFVTDEAMCRNEFVKLAFEQHQAREAARKPVIEAAMNLVRSTGLSPQKIGNYPGFVNALLTVAENTEPGSTARDQRLADVLGRHEQPYFDQALLRRLADLVLTLRDQRS